MFVSPCWPILDRVPTCLRAKPRVLISRHIIAAHRQVSHMDTYIFHIFNLSFLLIFSRRVSFHKERIWKPELQNILKDHPLSQSGKSQNFCKNISKNSLWIYSLTAVYLPQWFISELLMSLIVIKILCSSASPFEGGKFSILYRCWLARPS